MAISLEELPRDLLLEELPRHLDPLTAFVLAKVSTFFKGLYPIKAALKPSFIYINAMRFGNVSLVRWSLEGGRDKTRLELKSGLNTAARQGHLAAFRYVFETYSLNLKLKDFVISVLCSGNREFIRYFQTLEVEMIGDDALMAVVGSTDVELIREFLANGFVVNLRHFHGILKIGDADLVMSILEKYKFPLGSREISKVAESGNAPLLRSLWARVENKRKLPGELIIGAVRSGSEEMLAEVLEMPIESSLNALLELLKQRRYVAFHNVFDKLTPAPGVDRKLEVKLLHEAFRTPRRDIQEKLIGLGLKLDSVCILASAYRNDIPTIKWLLSLGTAWNMVEVFVVACEIGSKALAEFVESFGGQPCLNHGFVVRIAAERNHYHMVEWMLQRKYRIIGKTDLCRRAHRHFKVLDLLVAYGVRADVFNNHPYFLMSPEWVDKKIEQGYLVRDARGAVNPVPEKFLYEG